jgi:hypothetical protein
VILGDRILYVDSWVSAQRSCHYYFPQRSVLVWRSRSCAVRPVPPACPPMGISGVQLPFFHLLRVITSALACLSYPQCVHVKWKGKWTWSSNAVAWPLHWLSGNHILVFWEGSFALITGLLAR